MPDARIALVTSPIDLEILDRLDAGFDLVFLLDRALGCFSPAMVGRLVARRSMVVAVVSGEIEGSALAAALLSDYFALGDDALVRLESVTPEVVSGIVARIGGRAVGLLLEGRNLSAANAHRFALCDALVGKGSDSVEWARSWVGGRSGVALRAAAELIRARGGDSLERAMFAWLFATGEPRHGLELFLKKSPVDFRDSMKVETI